MALSLTQIDDGIEALSTNANELIDEARVLHERKSYARAFALAHLAREEISKANMLQATGARIVGKLPVDWKHLMQRLKDHKAKLRQEIAWQAISMLGTGNEEMSTMANLMLTKDGAEAFSTVRNDQKNAALYVGFLDGKFIVPRDTRTERQSWRTIELAAEALEELKFFRDATGPFSGREIGTFQMPNYDDPSVAGQHLEKASKLYALLKSVIERDQEKDSEQPKNDPFS
jgi:AbiV family abortive infection protein